jgi:heterotetrameric sarcosine oxidase alpha subunit
MTMQPNRLAKGGSIDRTKSLSFSFDGKTYTGYQGDTLASALLANNVKLIGRSFKYHRPRGVFSAGAEEPNAVVHLRAGDRQEPNTLATVAELFDGLVAESQNRGGSLRSDPSRINDLFKGFMPIGFYYKTFMGPFRSTKIWMLFEGVIRKAAGMGTASGQPDPDQYDHMSRHCEVLVVGGGPAGLMAAKSAAVSGGRVILVDERADLGGQLRHERYEIEGKPALEWVKQTVAELEAMENVIILRRTSAFGYYDHNFVGCVERVCDHLPIPVNHKPRQRIWNLQAKQVVFATGSHEQPMVFGNNDRPNIMLAGAVRAYVNEYGVLPGKQAVVFTSCDDAYRTAIDLADAGATVSAVVDTRTTESAYAQQLRDRNIKILQGYAVVNAHGNADGVNAVEVQSLSGTGSQRLQCDLVAMSNGWAPALHLFSQSGGKTIWDAERNIFVPGQSKQAECSVGAARGSFSLKTCLEEGAAAGAAAASSAGFSVEAAAVPNTDEIKETAYEPLWEAPDPQSGHPKKFVDHQDDVGSSDVQLAHREGYISVEHMKRYTTLGMGTDQGKTSNVPGLAIMAAARGCSIPEAGHTTFRPPYTPVSLGALGGAEIGEHFMPIRRTAIDSWHDEQGCKWIDAGIWRRPRYYPKAGETIRDAFIRETKMTRGSVGMCDVTTLGKIDLQGPDTAELLERLYINHWKKLAVGKARYGMMLREDGIVYDDGTTSRMAEDNFVMTTTTANAVKVMSNLEFYLQAVWPDLRVQVTSVTEQWSAIAVAGPNSREVLQKIVDIDMSNEAFPFMGASECVAAGIPKCRLFRISFSGELAFEINVPCDYGRYVWEKIYEAGQEFDIVPYGTETLGNMRIEKGHVAGPELDGRTTADDLGLGMMMSKKKEFVGKRLAYREYLTATDRKKFVGFVPVDGKTPLKAGSQIVANAHSVPPVEMVGHVTSTGYCVENDHPIALGLIKGGLEAWEDKTVYMSYPLRNLTVPMKVVHPVFVDPEGERLRG